MKKQEGKVRKDQRLVNNMKMLVRDSHELIEVAPKKQTRDGAADNSNELPKAKEVWRFVKNLVQEHMVVKEQLKALQQQQMGDF